MDEITWVTIATSAAIGAFAGAVVTAVANGLDRWREREARRKAAIFDRALEMAKLKIDVSLRVVEHRGGQIFLQDPIVYAKEYHSALASLHDNGSIPDGIDQALPIWQGEMPEWIRKKGAPGDR